MSNLQYRQSIIQEKRKKTPWRDFVMEIASHFPVNLYKIDGMISKYPDTPRKGQLILTKDKESYPLISSDYTGDFFKDFADLAAKNTNTNINTYGINENCEYAEAVYGAKNGYLSFSFGADAENILYSCFVRNGVKNILDSFYIENGSENVYMSYFVQSSSFVFFSKYITNCHNVWLSTNLVGCSECILCDNLENQGYCIRNKQYTKEEYESEKSKFLKEKSGFTQAYSELPGPVNKLSEGSKGKGLFNCKNVENGVLCRDVADCRNIICATGGYSGSSHIYDGLDVGLDTHDMYGTGMAGTNSSHLYCCSGITNSTSLFYCMYMESCSFCLGCIGLKNKSYCILNKQYIKEERYEEVDKIFGRMDADGDLGSFFPATMNPFYFNDTAAYLIDPSFTKEEVTKLGFLRRDEPIKVDIPAGVQTVKVSELGQFEGRTVGTQFFASDRFADGKKSVPTDTKRTINDEILKKVILDEQGNAYRIIPMELEFLRKYELPLPRKHWLDRMKENFRI